MAGYENAPATRLLATHCVVCGRPLVDARSVEMGIGPDCRDQYDGGIEDQTRQEANKIVHRAAIAAQRGKIAEVMEAADAIEQLGLAGLADAVRSRFSNAQKNVTISIVESNGVLIVTTPYRRGDAAAFIQAWRAIPGRSYDRLRNANVVPVAARRQLWDLLKQFFPGKYGKSNTGIFRVPVENDEAA
jgi:hypothetical protein